MLCRGIKKKMKIGEQYMISDLPKTGQWLYGMPFILKKIKDGVYWFVKESGNTQVRIDIKEENLKRYNITKV